MYKKLTYFFFITCIFGVNLYSQTKFYISHELKESCDSSIYLEWPDFKWIINGTQLFPNDSLKIINTNFPDIDTIIFYDANSTHSLRTIYTRFNPTNDYIQTNAMWYKDFNIYEKSLWDSSIYKMYDFSNGKRNADSIYYSTRYSEKVNFKVKNFQKDDSLFLFYGHPTDSQYFTGHLLTNSKIKIITPQTDFLESRNYHIILAKIKPNARIMQYEETDLTVTINLIDLEILYYSQIRLFENTKCNLIYNYKTKKKESMKFK